MPKQLAYNREPLVKEFLYQLIVNYIPSRNIDFNETVLVAAYQASPSLLAMNKEGGMPSNAIFPFWKLYLMTSLLLCVVWF